MNDLIQSEQVIIEAPLSFTGSARRLWRLSDNAWIEWLLLAPLIALVWTTVLAWYLFFGIWLVPYRLYRRGQRKQKRDIRRHAEMLRALKNE